jgi:hypothetical protein
MPEKPKPKKGDESFNLEVPLDASGIEDFKPDRKVKVAIQTRQGAIQAQLVEFDRSGKGVAEFAFEEKPAKLSLVVGPPDATDEELFGLQTLRVDVPSRLWKEPQLTLSPILIPSFHWHWWWRWCREFTVRGQVLCPDGRPVPGATVCAYDVDMWWWWSSRQLVGCDTTDNNGAFEIKFRWCCYWWPWWWWRIRVWHLEPFLLEHILPILEREPRIIPIPLPDPAPDLRIFEHILGRERLTALNLRRFREVKAEISHLKSQSAASFEAPETGTVTSAAITINPDTLGELREPLLEALPDIPELQQLHLWPWWPWAPWRDCTPDLIFRVTQDCTEPGAVIVEEGLGQTRWNIPTELDVTLTANDLACCLEDQDDDPEGACALITDVCHSPINEIGGNPGAPAAPAGYLDPGMLFNALHLPTSLGDRPFGENVNIHGQIGTAVDYYEFQWSNDGGASWHDMPGTAVGGFNRQYWIPATNTFQLVPFRHIVDGRLVYETRRHYEDTHDPGTWNHDRFWMATNYFLLMRWLTETPFIDGTYRLRIKGWQLVGGHLSLVQNLDFLPTCTLQTPAELVLHIDNRLVGAASGHPMADPNHPCGPGTVHTCTLEPDTDIIDVRILHRDENNNPTGPDTHVAACGTVPIGEHDLLQVDFFAYDPEGHLARYTLQDTYRENLAINLLTLAGASLTPLGGAPVPAAAQVGPNYFAARLAGAAAPTWNGGAIRLQVPAAAAFPETCCYQLELRAHKRTVANCNYSDWNHTNYSEYSFMIVV